MTICNLQLTNLGKKKTANGLLCLLILHKLKCMNNNKKNKNQQPETAASAKC